VRVNVDVRVKVTGVQLYWGQPEVGLQSRHKIMSVFKPNPVGEIASRALNALSAQSR